MDQVKFCIEFKKKTNSNLVGNGLELVVNPRIHLKLSNITISFEMIKKTVATLDYTKTPGNFVHVSKVVWSEF